MHLTLLAITGASSYSHKGPLRPSKLMGKDKAVPVAVVENSKAARRDNPFGGLDLGNATSAWQNQKAVCKMERERAPWPPQPVPEATRCLSHDRMAFNGGRLMVWHRMSDRLGTHRVCGHDC